MRRCIELARRGAGYVAPNPLVGAVLVYEDRIIGEGWHKKFGEPHAEVNCINQAIENGHGQHLSEAVLYVSLEPCAHYGKTPPCANLIIEKKIPRAFIGCRDPFAEVNGKGIEILKVAGVVVDTGILEQECIELNKRFFTFQTKHRPFVVLKWAQTGDGFIANLSMPGQKDNGSRLLISGDYSNRLVHQWRSEEAAILVGTNTALSDNPSLTTRLWPGPSPIRLVVDMDLRLPPTLHLFNQEQKTIVFNTLKHEENGNLLYYQVTRDVSLVHQIVHGLYQLNIQSVLVEGGAMLLQSFIDENIWDEARVIVNKELIIGKGLAAPVLNETNGKTEEQPGAETILYYKSLSIES